MDNTDNNKVMAVLCYIWLLWLVPLLTDAKDSEFVKFHINQGIVLTIAWVVLSLINIIPILGQIIFLIGSVVLIIFMVMGILSALKMETKELPVIGKFKVYK
ncbi:MAG: hypothetical protein R6W96_05355 [Clostridia bacterium]